MHYHIVDIKRLLAYLSNRLEDRETERDVWYEDTIHNIHVEPVGFTAVDHLYFVFQM
jgi:hypothetical protein